MLKAILKRSISLAMAFAALLSLSCCGVGDEVLIDKIDTETTSEEATETTNSETTEELTTLETTTEEITETTTEETSLTIPDEATILASLTDEEKEVWLSMPDIVTIRMLERFDDNDKKILYTEIVYIDKMGQTKKFVTHDNPNSFDDAGTIEWLNDQINQNEDVEFVGVADTHKLIKFYNALMCIDSNSKLYLSYSITPDEYIKRHYYFQIYGIRTDGKNDIETLRFSSNDAGNPHIRRNYTAKGEPFDTSGTKTLDLYLQLEPFMVLKDGGLGHLTGEEV